MLRLLHIENIALIEQAEITFEPAFNALTGETGAGKSIIIDALGAVLGRRTSRDLIRTGAEKAFVSAEFTVPEAVRPILEENGIETEEDGTLLLQRELYADGKNICRAGGRPITVAQLHLLGINLLNIHGQHEGQQLLDEEEHLHYLDAFGNTADSLEAYRSAFSDVRAIREEIASLAMDEAEKARRVDTLRHQIAELERAELKEGEEEELAEKRNLLRNGEKLLSALESADLCLNGGENGEGAVSAIQEAGNALHGLRGLGDSFVELSDRLQSLYCEVYDLASILRDKRAEFDFSPEELDAVESRSDLLYRIRKKYGASVEECIAYLNRSRDELDRIEYADDRIERLQSTLLAKTRIAEEKAAALSKRRKDAAQELEARITQELRELDMAKIRFQIDFSAQEMASDGIDAVRFLMSANEGEALKPIDRIASGGELARIMLALKNVLAEQDHVETLVFDEVDTGVSGRAAQRIAEKLARVSCRKQVLCVTHLPQITAMADTHFCVQKQEEKGRTYTRVLRLDRAQRREELSRLTGSGTATETQLQGAEELLAAAERYRAQFDKNRG